MLKTLRNIKGSKVWITGASSGIGKDMAEMAAEAGAALYLFSSNENKLRAAAVECEKHGTQPVYYKAVDLANPDASAGIFETTLRNKGVPDILILNAGIAQRSRAGETDLSVVRKIMDVNFVSAAALAGIILPAMAKNGGGRIGVTGSLVSLFGFPLRSAYAASKHALHGFFETVDLEYASSGIRVTIAVPGRIKTPFSLSALTGNGTLHGRMDAGQLGGMDSRRCAEKFWKAVLKGRRSVYIAGWGERIMILLHRHWHGLFRFAVRHIDDT